MGIGLKSKHKYKGKNMKVNRRYLWIEWVAFSFFICLFLSTTLNAETIANITYTESEITIRPLSDYNNISLSITEIGESSVFTKILPIEITSLLLSEFNNKKDVSYKLLLSAEPNQVLEAQGRIEDGREAKTYQLKKTVTQSETFQVVDTKIYTKTIIEE